MKQNKKLIQTITQTLLSTGFEHTIIQSIAVSDQLIELILQLPYHTDLDDLKHILPNLQMELSATDHKIINTNGKQITIHFGKANIVTVPFDKSSHFKSNTLKITLVSSYGPITIDFADGASCHMLTGGATRMGKTIFQLYLTTLLYTQNNGNIDLYIATTKTNDFYPFKHIPGVELVKTEVALQNLLDNIITDYKNRDNILDTLNHATDAKSVKQLYPDKYYLFRPIFLIIDEYSRFADNPEIKKQIQELVETAGYLNVHVIISTTRPDARTVLTPRIKANLNCRICFHTSDTNNSVVILDEEGAENLPNIPGRAILRDGEKSIIQVPYLSYEKCIELLSNYERNVPRETINITENKQDHPRQNDKNLSLKIQNMFKESASLPTIQTEHESDKRMQPHYETVNNGWFRLTSPSVKR